MTHAQETEVLIIGGSYAGLAAALALKRALRRVVVLDSGRPCNRQTPHSHNFLTQDGETPAAIRARALQQVLRQAVAALAHGDTGYARIESDASADLTLRGWKVDYVAVRELAGLAMPRADSDVSPDSLVVLAAATLGTTRLIDNLAVKPD